MERYRALICLFAQQNIRLLILLLVFVANYCQGEMYYLKEGEIGDAKRMCIGGVGSLYRAMKYSGNWEHNERNGTGMLTYCNGDTLQGNFLHGQPHGVLLYTFHSTAKSNGRGKLIARTRGARFERGERIEWIDEKAPLMKMLEAISL